MRGGGGGGRRGGEPSEKGLFESSCGGVGLIRLGEERGGEGEWMGGGNQIWWRDGSCCVEKEEKNGETRGVPMGEGREGREGLEERRGEE